MKFFFLETAGSQVTPFGSNTMKNRSSILVPTDFSEPSENAFQYALQFASDCGASIKVVHVVYPQIEGQDLPLLVSSSTVYLVEAAEEDRDRQADARGGGRGGSVRRTRPALPRGIRCYRFTLRSPRVAAERVGVGGSAALPHRP